MPCSSFGDSVVDGLEDLDVEVLRHPDSMADVKGLGEALYVPGVVYEYHKGGQYWLKVLKFNWRVVTVSTACHVTVA